MNRSDGNPTDRISKMIWTSLILGPPGQRSGLLTTFMSARLRPPPVRAGGEDAIDLFGGPWTATAPSGCWCRVRRGARSRDRNHFGEAVRRLRTDRRTGSRRSSPLATAPTRSCTRHWLPWRSGRKSVRVRREDSSASHRTRRSRRIRRSPCTSRRRCTPSLPPRRPAPTSPSRQSRTSSSDIRPAVSVVSYRTPRRRARPKFGAE